MLSPTHIGKFGGPSMPPEWLLKGFSASGAGTSAQAPRPLHQRSDRGKLRIANFVGLSGPSGIWGPASINSSLLAASEINRRGGILGREIEIAVKDVKEGRVSDELQDEGLKKFLARSHVPP